MVYIHISGYNLSKKVKKNLNTKNVSTTLNKEIQKLVVTVSKYFLILTLLPVWKSKKFYTQPMYVIYSCQQRQKDMKKPVPAVVFW